MICIYECTLIMKNVCTPSFSMAVVSMANLPTITNQRATSSPLSALVFMSQIVVYTIRLNVPLHMYIENELTGIPYMVLKALLVLCSILELRFLSFC